MPPAPLALSLGDPAGIGPEIVIVAWRALRHSGPDFVVVGDARALEAVKGEQSREVRRVSGPAEAAEAFAETLPVMHRPAANIGSPGQPDPANAGAIISWIETAATLALCGDASGVVTAPIAKAPLYAGGFAFPGHTEFLGKLAPPNDPQARGPLMMLAVPDLRVALVTIHEPLAKVPELLTQALIVNAGLVTAQALRRDLGVDTPQIAVTGLNPHAGEDGAIGGEEQAIIAPAIQTLRDLGVHATGPHPADSLFHPEARKGFDAALCMYHDQALIPVKMLDFWGGVNITLGLPIVRTSPDHGTGFDIAGKGLARPDSLIAAIRMAAQMAARRAAA